MSMKTTIDLMKLWKLHQQLTLGEIAKVKKAAEDAADKEVREVFKRRGKREFATREEVYNNANLATEGGAK